MISMSFARSAALASSVLMATPTGAHYSDVDEYIKKAHDSFLQTLMSGCCYGDEVIVNFDQSPLPDGSYLVVVPPRSYPGQEKEETIIFTRDKVRLREEIEKRCLQNNVNRPEAQKTCTPIPLEMNVAFLDPKTMDPYCVVPRVDLG